MPNKEGIFDFEFDTTAFKSGLEESLKSYTSFVKSIENKTEKSSKGMKMDLKKVTQKELMLAILTTMKEGAKGAPGVSGGGITESGIENAVFKGGMKLAAVGGLIVKGFKAAMDLIKEFVPEIGQTIHLAREIIFKNLFWPLRQAIMPYLQKVLDWVKNNRVAFVKLGGVLVNVFQLVMTTAKSVWNILKPLLDGVKDFIRSFIGGKGFSETINIAIFKLAVLVKWFEALLIPLFASFGTLIRSIGENKGFKDSIQDLKDLAGTSFAALILSLKSIVDLLNDIVNMDFTKTKKNMAELASEGTLVAKYKVGKGLAASLERAIEESMVRLTPMTRGESLRIESEMFEKRKQGMVPYTEYLGKLADKIDASMRTYEKTGKYTPVNDVAIMANGRVYKPAPGDNIYASKGGMGGVSLNISSINITTTEGDARAAGMNFVGGMEQQLRNLVNKNLLVQGAY